jgi:hypothetical protein
MATPLKIFRKSTIDRRRLYLDYSCWLADAETLTDFQVTVLPYTEGEALVVTSGYPDTEHKKLVLFVSGGKGNTNYTMQMVVRTNAGQVKRTDLGMRVMP